MLRNFREIAGFSGVDGRPVRRGTLFRSAALIGLTEADRCRLDNLGIRSVVDLRHAAEAEASPTDPLDDLDVRIHRVPFLPGPADGGEAQQEVWQVRMRFIGSLLARDLRPGMGGPERGVRQRERALAWAHRRIVAETIAGYELLGNDNRATIGVLLRLLGDPGHLPAVIHCRAGKDRTGIATAFALLAVGVSAQDIDEDYRRSNEDWAYREIDELARSIGCGRDGYERDLIELLGAPRGVMPAFLDAQRTAYASIDELLVTGLGLSADEILRLRGALLE
jgi:protein-tyrosine phosphatase